GRGEGPARSVAGAMLLVVKILAVEACPDRFEPTRALQSVLAAHAGGHLGHGQEPLGRDGLLALLAEPVLAGAQALERLGQLVGALHEKAPHREAHLAVLVDTDDVHVAGQGHIVPVRAGKLLDHYRAARLADPVHRAIQLRFQALSDVFHGSLILSGQGIDLGMEPTLTLSLDARETRTIR